MDVITFLIEINCLLRFVAEYIKPWYFREVQGKQPIELQVSTTIAQST